MILTEKPIFNTGRLLDYLKKTPPIRNIMKIQQNVKFAYCTSHTDGRTDMVSTLVVIVYLTFWHRSFTFKF